MADSTPGKSSTPSSKKKKKPLRPPSSSSEAPATPTTPKQQTNKSSASNDPTQQKISDLCINLHRYVQSWENLNTRSFKTVNSLINLHSQLAVCPESHAQFSAECLQKLRMKMVNMQDGVMRDFRKEMDEFKQLIDKVVSTVDNLKAIFFLSLVTSSLSDGPLRIPSSTESPIRSATESPNRGRPATNCELPATNCDNDSKLDCQISANNDITAPLPVFNTWPAKTFYTKSLEISDMLSKEYLLKEKLAGLIVSHCTPSEAMPSQEDDSTMYVTLWLQQPYIHENIDFYVNTILVEANLKEF